MSALRSARLSAVRRSCSPRVARRETEPHVRCGVFVISTAHFISFLHLLTHVGSRRHEGNSRPLYYHRHRDEPEVAILVGRAGIANSLQPLPGLHRVVGALKPDPNARRGLGGRRIDAKEACRGGRHLGRVFATHGCDFRLMSADYVRPCAKAQKADDLDTEAIANGTTRAESDRRPVGRLALLTHALLPLTRGSCG